GTPFLDRGVVPDRQLHGIFQRELVGHRGLRPHTNRQHADNGRKPRRTQSSLNPLEVLPLQIPRVLRERFLSRAHQSSSNISPNSSFTFVRASASARPPAGVAR